MTFTSDQLIALVCLILTVMQIINLWITLRGKAQDPDRKRDERIAELTTDNEKLKGDVRELRCQLDRSRENLDRVKATMLDSTAVLMKAVQALITHELDGNNTVGLQKSQAELSKFVWDRLGHKED